MAEERDIVRVEQVETMPMVDAAEVDMQVATAKKYPRSIKRFRERILELATIDKETAEECWYALPRGGKVIEGPSVRFAEIVAASYGNLRVASRHVNTGEKFVSCEGVCWDLENNVAMKSTVNRRITGRRGRFDDDMIGVTIAAANSIASRNAVFKVVPKAIFQRSLDEVKKIAMGSGRTITEVRKAIVEHFKGMNVPVAQLLSLTGRNGLEDLTLEDATMLRGVATAIKEGTTTIAEVFSPDRKAPESTTIPKDAIKKGSAEAHSHPGEAHVPEAKPKAKSRKKAAPEPTPEPTPEPDALTVARKAFKTVVSEVSEQLSDDVVAEEVWMAGITEGIEKFDNIEAIHELCKKLKDLASG